MSECVVRMEMPESCAECRERWLFARCPCYTGHVLRRSDRCPIICALPENHGRLIDADKIDYYEVERFGEPHYMVWKPHIDGQPTLVPATETEATPCP